MQSSNESDHPTAGTHLAPERLAAFDEMPFTADEAAHLAACAACRAEHDAMLAVVGMAAAFGRQEIAADAPRLVEFESIMAGLRASDDRAADEGSAGQRERRMPAGASAGHHAPVIPVRRVASRRAFAPLLRRAAAAVLLVGGGVLAGRMSSELGGATGGLGLSALATSGAGATSVSAATVSASPVSLSERPFADRSYASVEQATIALNEAQREYERASLWLASNDTTMRDPEVFRARLAALDQMMEASRVALRDAPQDPVLNHYYLAAYSAREATLQALSSALPVDKIIERY